MILVKYYVGMGVDKDGQPVQAGIREADNIITDAFPGATRYVAMGTWTNEDGQRVKEPCLVYEVLTDRGNTYCRDIAERLKEGYNQASVLMIYQNDIEAVFV